MYITYNIQYNFTLLYHNEIYSVERSLNSKDHSIDHLEIVCVEKIRDQDIHLRKVRETFWIQKLNTLHPHGLNRNLGIGDGIRKET